MDDADEEEVKSMTAVPSSIFQPFRRPSLEADALAQGLRSVSSDQVDLGREAKSRKERDLKSGRNESLMKSQPLVTSGTGGSLRADTGSKASTAKSQTERWLEKDAADLDLQKQHTLPPNSAVFKGLKDSLAKDSLVEVVHVDEIGFGRFPDTVRKPIASASDPKKFNRFRSSNDSDSELDIPKEFSESLSGSGKFRDASYTRMATQQTLSASMSDAIVLVNSTDLSGRSDSSDTNTGLATDLSDVVGLLQTQSSVPPSKLPVLKSNDKDFTDLSKEGSLDVPSIDALQPKKVEVPDLETQQMSKHASRERQAKSGESNIPPRTEVSKSYAGTKVGIESFLLKTGGVRNAPAELKESMLFSNAAVAELIQSAPLGNEAGTYSSASASYTPTPEAKSDVVGPEGGEGVTFNIREKSKTMNGKMTDRDQTDPLTIITRAVKELPTEKSFKKNKKPEKIEEIEDGGRVINRQNSRPTYSRAASSKRGGKGMEKGFMGLRGSVKSTKNFSTRFISIKGTFAAPKTVATRDTSDDESDLEDDEEYEYEESECDDEDSIANFHVRLEEGSLSEGSFIRVASEYELGDNLFFENADGAESKPEVKATEKSVVGGGLFPHKPSRMLSHMERISVLDCIVRLLAGTRVTKQLRFKRYRERWIYLGNDLATLNWRSSKRSKDIEAIVLKKVRRLQINSRYLVIWTRTYRMKVLLETREEAKTWLTGLVRLIPSTAEVMDGKLMVEMPEIYDPLKDSWRGKAVGKCKKINDYVLLGDIGHGSFGKVKLSLSKKDKKFYAVKIIADPGKMKRILQPSEKEATARLKKLSHPNVVKHRDLLYNEEKQKVVYVLEYMSRGVLLDCSKLEHNKPLDEDLVREQMRDVVCGLLYLHRQGIVHRDIKPANLLRSGDGRVKISDFGEAKFYNLTAKDDKENTGVPGTPAFLAPEFCVSAHCPKGNAQQYAVDVWSLGASIFYLVFGSVPFVGDQKSILAMYDAICTEELKFPDEPQVSRHLKDLLKAMLTKSPQKRIDMNGVAEHPWFGSSRPPPATGPRIEVTEEEIEEAVQKATWIYPEK